MKDMEKGKILVTGGNGFIGSHVVHYLRQKGYRVEAPSSRAINVLRKEDWVHLREEDIQHVVHLAGKTFVPDSWKEPEEFFRVNTMGILQVLDLCRNRQIGMTYISAYVYGEAGNEPISETAPVKPNNVYAKSKYMTEELCEFFCEYFNVDITTLRLFNVYGPGQDGRFLIPSVINQVLDNDKDTIVVQNLIPKRDYVHVYDVCRVIELSIQNTRNYHVFNVGSGESYSVEEIVNLIQEDAHTKKKVNSLHLTRKNELSNVIADIGKIEREWGWKPKISLRDGLHTCLEDKK